MLFLFLLSAQASIPAALFPGVVFPPALFSAALFILFLIILLVIILIIPIHLTLNFRKQGPLIQGGYRIAWLGLTLRKREVLPQPAADLLASILKKESKEERGKAEKGKADEGRETADSGDEQKSDIKRSPELNFLSNAAYAIVNLLLNLLKSIVLQKLSCRLCFGLNDPAETAVMSGYLWSVASTLGLFRAKVFIEPFFEGERLEGEFAAELKIRLFWIVWAVINALREKEIRSLIREVAGWD